MATIMKTSPATFEVSRSTPFMKVMGVLAIIGGAAFCATLIGAIIGIPAILVGISWLNDAKLFKGSCPVCSNAIQAAVVEGKTPAVTCGSCKSRLVVQDKLFKTVE